MELTVGGPAAGGGFVSRGPDGRIVFVRHALPGERVRALVTSETSSFLRADAVEILEPAPERVVPPCTHAGPGGCGGCDYQHVERSMQRRLKAELVSEQLRRLARLDVDVEVEEVPDSPDGLGWRTRVTFAVDDDGALGLHRHRSHQVIALQHCAIAADEVHQSGALGVRWPGIRNVEIVTASGSPTVVAVVDAPGSRPPPLPDLPVGVVWRGRTLREPGHVEHSVAGRRLSIKAGVFWQVHRSAGEVLTRAVMDALEPQPGERAADLYAGAGLFTVALADAVGPRGSVVAVERSAAAVADLREAVAGFGNVDVRRSDVSPELVSRRLGRPSLVVLDPSRQGAGREVMAALVNLDPSPRAMTYVSCDPAPLARDLAVALEAGWTVRSLRAFDIFPMTEHVEVVVTLVPGHR